MNRKFHKLAIILQADGTEKAIPIAVEETAEKLQKQMKEKNATLLRVLDKRHDANCKKKLMNAWLSGASPIELEKIHNSY